MLSCFVVIEADAVDATTLFICLVLVALLLLLMCLLGCGQNVESMGCNSRSESRMYRLDQKPTDSTPDLIVLDEDS